MGSSRCNDGEDQQTVNLRLTGLNVYPIKSARGIPLDRSDVDELGLRYDRRWMVVDQTGEFITQRNYPRLALVTPRIGDGALRIDAPGMTSLELPLDPDETVFTRVSVWKDRFDAAWLGEKPARWFSEFLDCSCSLVYMSPQVTRPADPRYAPPGARVGFADAFPFLVISEESLEDLNRRLAAPLPMNRFRPNLVVAGAEPYAEDGWDRIRVNDITFSLVKPCDRCVITTTDQATATRGREPLRTLATYRNVNGKVLFGQNAVHDKPGHLRVGEEVQASGRSTLSREVGHRADGVTG
jgi:uncharacterized protein